MSDFNDPNNDGAYRFASWRKGVTTGDPIFRATTIERCIQLTEDHLDWGENFNVYEGGLGGTLVHSSDAPVKGLDQKSFTSWRTNSAGLSGDIPLVEAKTLEGCVSRTKKYLGLVEKFAVCEGGRDGKVVFNSHNGNEGEISHEEAAMRLKSLARGAALYHAQDETPGLTRRDKCVAVAVGILSILEGRTGHFPKCDMYPSPHVDDKEGNILMGDPYYEDDIPCSEGLSETLQERIEKNNWLPDVTDCRPYTADEIRDQIIGSALSSAEYWGKDKSVKDDTNACEGTAFSVLAALDGCTTGLPMIDVAPCMFDIQNRPEVYMFKPEIINAYFHEGFHQAEPVNPYDAPDPIGQRATSEMNLFSVSVPGSVEDSSFYVVAADEPAAAGIYVQAVDGGDISVDEEEMEILGSLSIKHIGKEATGDARVISWDSDEVVTMRMQPYSSASVYLSDILEWNKADNSDAMEP